MFRVGEPHILFAAPAPDFFTSGFGFCLFQMASDPRRQKHAAFCGSSSNLFVKFGKIFFTLQPTNVRTARNIKRV